LTAVGDLPTGRRDDVAVGWMLVDALIKVRRRVAIPAVSRSVPYLMLLPAVGLVLLFLGGLLDLIWSGFHNYDAFRGVQGSLSLDQYRRLFTGEAAEHYRRTIVTTVVMSLIVTVTAVALALPVTYFILRIRSRIWRFVAMTLLLVPFLMGEIVRAFRLVHPAGAQRADRLDRIARRTGRGQSARYPICRVAWDDPGDAAFRGARATAGSQAHQPRP
jgi:hypothetical protein